MARWVSTKHAPGLSNRRSTNTGIERELRSRLWKAGIRYRLHPELGERLTADFLIVPAMVCVFVDGCFWHQCPKHKPAPTTGANATLWRTKFERTRERDVRATTLAELAGYLPMRFWECEIREKPNAVIQRITDALKERTAKR